MENPFTDEYFMKKALQEAEIAFEKGEVPVGALIVVDNKIIARTHNLTELLNDVTAHAENTVGNHQFARVGRDPGNLSLKVLHIIVLVFNEHIGTGAAFRDKRSLDDA